MSKLTVKNAALFAVALTSMFALSACDVDQTKEGEMPKVEVTSEGGQMPEYEVETAEVQTGTKTVEVEVPTATIEMPSDSDAKVTDETDSSDQ